MSMSLSACCERRDLANKKSDITKDYWDKGIGYEAMPWDVVEEYGRADIRATRDLYLAQIKGSREYYAMLINLSNSMCMCLSEMEYGGLAIDEEKLDHVEFNYRMEKKERT